eukprot:Hpha_TRINITY_DN31977_c0_g1::TRINITY_DN31977_c0_g1_i1::g.21966::m.21966
MCEVKSTFRRLNMEVEFQKHARRVKREGIWHEISHQYWRVSDPSVVFVDNDIIEVWLDDSKWITQGGNSTFTKDDVSSVEPTPATPMTPISVESSALVTPADPASPTPDRPPTPPDPDEGAAEVSRGRGKYLRKFIIEQIYVTRQRKCLEGFFWDDTKRNGIHILNEERPAVLFARQTVRKLEHPRHHEIVGAMKKQREKVDKLIREEEGAKARIKALEEARKKKAKEIDFSKPSVWGDRRDRKKKKESKRAGKDAAKVPPTTPATPQLPETWVGFATQTFLDALSSPLRVCCGVRPRPDVGQASGVG